MVCYSKYKAFISSRTSYFITICGMKRCCMESYDMKSLKNCGVVIPIMGSCGMMICVMVSCDMQCCGIVSNMKNCFMVSCGMKRCGMVSCGMVSYGMKCSGIVTCGKKSCGMVSCGIKSCGMVLWYYFKVCLAPPQPPQLDTSSPKRKCAKFEGSS